MSTSPLPAETTPAVEAEPDATKIVRKAHRRHARFVPLLPKDNAVKLDEWLLSYADMVTLLLTMFVALLLNAHFGNPGAGPGAGTGAGPGAGGTSPRQIIEQLFQLHVASPYGDDQTYTITSSRDASPVLAPEQGAALAVVKDEDLDRIRQREEALGRIRYWLKAAQLDTFITASAEADGIRLNIPNSILFDSGAADLKGRGPDVLRTLAPLLSADRFIVSVEGHTDTSPIKTERFPSNWELSAQRAATVVRTLVETGVDPHRLQAVGYGETRPLADNAAEEGRRENRRVTLFLRTP